MSASAYALNPGLLNPSIEEYHSPSGQQYNAGTASQLTEQVQQVGLWFFRALVQPRAAGVASQNSFVTEPKGLSSFEPFPSLSPGVLESLRSVETLEMGWAGDEAQPVSPKSIAAARELLLSLKAQRPAAQDARILPIVDGRLQIEWHDADRSLEFEFIGPDWIAIGLDRSDPNAATKYYTIEIDSPGSPTFAAAYDWFIQRNPKIAPWPSR